MNSLLLVNLGPVQDFIASARRTRDLAFGSWFLSELARAAAREIHARNGLLIFPAPTESIMLKPNTADFPVPNKIIARIQDPPHEISKYVRQAVMDRLHDIRESAFNGGISANGEKTYQEIPFARDKRVIANAQVEDLVEFLWAALPFTDEANYQQTRKDLEALMAARKNTRNFASVNWGDYLPKSSLSGQLESVIPEEKYPAFHAPAEKKHARIRDLYNQYGAGPAERLSGVDLLKRRGVTAFGGQFPSTSHMATLPFLKRLELLSSPQQQKQARVAWEKYLATIQALTFFPLEYLPEQAHPIVSHFQGSILLESRLADVLYIPGEEKENAARLHEAQSALQTFYQTIDQQFKTLGFPKARPEPYYAFVQADGDSMGSIIDAQAAHSYQQHQKLSQQLSHFAAQARDIVARHQGALVYAGGDDVLAFLPLHTVLECVSQLASTFRTTLQEFKGQQGQIPSLSAGVAIVHHLESLQSVRQLAREAERRAKDAPDKNALAIILSKRSGSAYHIVGQWGDLDRSLLRLSDFYRREAIPVGTAYELRDLLLRLAGIPSATAPGIPANDLLGTVIAQDAQRILQRKLNVPPGKFSEKQIEEIERFFHMRLVGNQAGEQSEDKTERQADGGRINTVSLDAFINELVIAKTLADARLIADPKKEKSHV